MSGIDGLGGGNNVYNQTINGPQDIDDLKGTQKTQGTGANNVDSPQLELGGVNTGVTYSRPSPLQSSNLVLPASITDSTNVDITACLVLLMQTAIEMRRDQREQWMTQAQNALETSNTAADLQIEAAKNKLIADCVTTGVQAAVSVASCAVAIGEAAAGSSAEKAISKEADETYGKDADIKASETKGVADEEADIDTQAKSIIGKEGLTGDSLGGESTGLGETKADKTQKSISKAKEAEVERADAKATTDVADAKASNKAADAKSADDAKAQMKAKKEFKAQRMAAETANLQARSQALRAAIEVGGSAGKMIGSGLSYEADLDTAMAAKVKALADFQNTAASDQLDFANELRDYTSSILSTIRDVESARHAASNSIANI